MSVADLTKEELLSLVATQQLQLDEKEREKSELRARLGEVGILAHVVAIDPLRSLF